jgi:hypothetical protein
MWGFPHDRLLFDIGTDRLGSQHNQNDRQPPRAGRRAQSAETQVYRLCSQYQKVVDITTIWTMEGWLYLAVVLDIVSQVVVSWLWTGIGMRRSYSARPCRTKHNKLHYFIFSHDDILSPMPGCC